MFIRIARWRNRWLPSEFPSLPTADASQADPSTRDYLLLARGLAMLLAHCSPRAAERELPCALNAYRALRLQVRRRAELRLSAQLLNDLSHEIALCADAGTRAAALRCLRRCLPQRSQVQFA